MEAEDRFYCPVENCGRSFSFKNALEKHMERRHPGVTVEPDPQPQEEEKRSEVLEIEENGELEQHPQNPVSLSLLLANSGMDRLEDIELLTLKSLQLTDFNSGPDFDIEDLVSLQYMSLSFNYIQDLSGVAFCTSLQELNINNNRVQSLGPLEALVELKKLFAANNLIREIVSLKTLRKLTHLHLSKNRLYDLDTSLKVLRALPNLQELALDRNPCMLQVKNAKYKVIRFLKITQLDDDEVTDLDREIAADLFSLPEKAVIPQSGFVARLRATAEIEKKRELSDVYAELDQLYSENSQLKQENESLKRQNPSENPKSVDSLQLEIAHLKREVANVYVLLDENKELREQLERPLQENELLAELAEENQRLKTRIMSLEERISELKKRPSNRPQTSVGAIRPKTSAGRSTSLLEVTEEDDELDAIMAKSSRSLQQMREWLREMQG